MLETNYQTNFLVVHFQLLTQYNHFVQHTLLETQVCVFK
jgi:hypothetical protein